VRLAVCIILVAAYFLGVLATIAYVGKPRRPLQASTAAGVFGFNLLYALMTVYLYLSGE